MDVLVFKLDINIAITIFIYYLIDLYILIQNLKYKNITNNFSK